MQDENRVSVNSYLDRLLYRYSGTFDIHKPYRTEDFVFYAYGYFYSRVEKYVLVREANMWSSDSFEHVFFVETEECSIELLQKCRAFLTDYIEPVLVRKGEKLPSENHMYSYLTFGIVCRKPLTPDVRLAVKKFKYEKGYNFNMRGFSQAHIVCATMEDEKVITNYAGRKSKKLYREIFEEVRAGKPGFQ